VLYWKTSEHNPGGRGQENSSERSKKETEVRLEKKKLRVCRLFEASDKKKEKAFYEKARPEKKGGRQDDCPR